MMNFEVYQAHWYLYNTIVKFYKRKDGYLRLNINTVVNGKSIQMDATDEETISRLLTLGEDLVKRSKASLDPILKAIVDEKYK